VQLSHPLRVVTASLDGDLLAVLSGADAAFTGRQLARMVAASSEGARMALTRLVEQGVVHRQPAGAAQMFRLNRDHLAAGPILALASLREQFLDRVRAELAAWAPGPAYAALFGSSARGDERPDSDIDVFLLRPTGVDGSDAGWRAQAARLEADMTRWTGNDARILEFSADDLARHRRPGRDPDVVDDSVVDDVLRDGIPLAGDPGLLRMTRRSPRSPG
jgi:hypothetical protein